jgi:hypothetical protein
VRPIRIKGYKAKAGRLVKVSTARSVSDKIREKKSKKARPVRRGHPSSGG